MVMKNLKTFTRMVGFMTLGVVSKTYRGDDNHITKMYIMNVEKIYLKS